MLPDWSSCKNILVVRADNIGDLLMSAPAIRALKDTFDCRITLLTSSAAAEAVSLLPEIDDLLVADFPWVRKDRYVAAEAVLELIDELKKRQFDAGVVFSVYSQNTWAAAHLLWLAGIPRRLAYSRENPYELINYWLPDKEPLQEIMHQVERDLRLVEKVGARVRERHIRLNVDDGARRSLAQKLEVVGVSPSEAFLVFHSGVSEKKRRYPIQKWIETGLRCCEFWKQPILLTGSGGERSQCEYMEEAIGGKVFSLAGDLEFHEFAALIERAKLLVSVNTSAVHLAAGLATPVVVLYAQTNPQHFPWMVKSRVLQFSVPKDLSSRNTIIQWVNEHYYAESPPFPESAQVTRAIAEMLGFRSSVV